MTPRASSHEGNRAPQLLILCCLILIALATFWALPIKYALPDDFVQDLFVRGAYYDDPTLLMPYSYLLFSAPVASLYHALPALPWYPIALIALQVMGFWLAGSVVLNAPVNRATKLVLIGLILLLHLVCCTYFTFTVTAFIATGAGLAQVCSHACFRVQKRLGAQDVLACVLIALGTSLRFETAPACLMIFAPFFIFALIKQRKAKTFGVAALTILCMVAPILVGKVAYQATPGWETFERRANAARSVADWPEISLQQAQEAVPSFSQNDLDMAYEFLFTDTQTFSHATFTALDAQVTSYKPSYALSAILARKSFTASIVGFWAAALLLGLALITRARIRGVGARLFVLSPVLMLAAAYALVFLRARLKMHVFLPLLVVCVFALVATTYLIYLGSMSTPKPNNNAAPDAALNLGTTRGLHDSPTLMARALTVVLIGAFLAVSGVVELKFVRPNLASLHSSASQAATTYVQEHPDQLILFAHNQGLVTNGSALSFERWSLPTHVIFAGGYEHMTGSWQRFVEANHLNTNGIYLALNANASAGASASTNVSASANVNASTDTTEGSPTSTTPRMVAIANERQAKMLATYLSEHLPTSDITAADTPSADKNLAQVSSAQLQDLGTGADGQSYYVWSFSA